MFSRYIDKVDFKSRFRILKGGKVSLVVSAMLISSSLVGTSVNAVDISISGPTSISLSGEDNIAQTIGDTFLSEGDFISVNGGNITNAEINILHNVVVDSSNNISAIEISNLGEDSLIVNYGMINVDANSEVDITTDLIDNNNIDLKSIGINVASAVQSSEDGESTIINNATLTSDALLTINVTGGRKTFLLASEAKGISVNSLQGTDSDHESKINNNEDGNIEVSSKLNINFENEGDSIEDTDGNGINSKAIGIEVGSSAYYASIRNEGEITSLSEITIDEKGTINTSYVYAVSSGILVNSVEHSEIVSNVIDSQAIFNGTNYASAISNGIYINSGVEDSVIGSFDIISKAQATATNENGESYSEASGIQVGGEVVSSMIINAGDIEAEATSEADGYSSARAYGINIDSRNGGVVSNGEEDATANLKVTATATSTNGAASAESYGMYLYDSAGTQVLNYGTIEVTATADSYNYNTANAMGIMVSTDQFTSPSSTITNFGTITAKANISMQDANNRSVNYGIKVMNYSENIFTLENKGTVEAYINDNLDRDAYALYLDRYHYLAADIEASSSGILKGNIFVEGTLTNSGLISLPYNAFWNENFPYNAFIKNFTNTGTGTLEIGLLTKGSVDNTTYSKLETNTATFNNGSTINVNVLEASQNVGLLAGSKLENVVTASTALTIENKLNITDNSALLNFEYETSGLEGDPWTNGGAGSINLKIIKGQTVEEAVTNISPKVTQHTNAQGAANALDRIIDNIDNNPQMQTVITRLNQLSSNEAVARAVESTTPVAANATVGATTQISNGIAGIVTQRQNANISGGMNSGDGMFSENNMWIKPFGSIGSQNNKDGINGFDVKTYGLGFGADTEYKNNQKLGLAFFYTNANVDVNNMNQNADLDVFTTLVYGNVPIIDDKTNFLYQVGYSWQKTQTDREVFTGDKAESKYTSKTASLDLKLMRDVNVNKDLLLQPLVNTTYRHFTNPAYNETGADALNLNVDKFTSTDLIVGLGTLAHYKLDKESKIVGNVNVGYDLHDKNQTVTSAYEGASGVSFETQGIDNGRWSYEAGIGYEKDISATSAINVAYDYQGQGTDFSNNIISAKYVLKF